MPRIRFLAAMILLAASASARGQDRPAASATEPLLIEQPRGDYRARRGELMTRIKAIELRRATSAEPVVIVRGGDDAGKEDFEEGRFRQRNDFAYLTGVEAPGAWLVLRPVSGLATLYLPPKGRLSVMNGEDGRPGPGPEAAEALGFDAVEPTSKVLGDVFAAIADPMRPKAGGGGVVYTLAPNPGAQDAGPDAKISRFLREGAPNTTFRDLAPVVAEMRKVKTPAEMLLLQRAIDITGAANEAVIAALRPGLFEFQVEGKILGAFLDGGSLRPGFKSIVGSGPNSTVPHYFLSARKMDAGDLVVVDIGAEYGLYTADVTRTYPVGGTFTPRQREVYDLVLAAQRAAEAEMKPGVTTLAAMTGFVGEFFRKSPLRAKDEGGQERTMDHFFVHGLGHYLGLDVHDVGDTRKPMQVGEVFTIEPGIYIKGENLGVRIEDDYLMTESGPVKLSKKIASDPDEIERKIAGAKETDGGGRVHRR